MAELIIDVGNTKSKLALAEKGKMLDEGVSYSDHETTARDAIAMARRHEATCCLVSCVAEGGGELIRLINESGLPCARLTADMRLPFAIDYATPQTLGTDRIAGAAGVFATFGKCDALVIDAGTAITYDFLSAEGVFRGGAISPGISMRFKALHAFTAKLPLCAVEPRRPAAIGRDTREAIASGVVNGVVAEADYFVAQARELNPETIVVLTGGDCHNFELTSKMSIFARPNVVLDGLAWLADANRKEIFDIAKQYQSTD